MPFLRKGSTFRRRGVGDFSSFLCSIGVLTPDSATCSQINAQQQMYNSLNYPNPGGVTSQQLQEITPGTPGTTAASDIAAGALPSAQSQQQGYSQSVQDFFTNLAAQPQYQTQSSAPTGNLLCSQFGWLCDPANTAILWGAGLALVGFLALGVMSGGRR